MTSGGPCHSHEGASGLKPLYRVFGWKGVDTISGVLCLQVISACAYDEYTLCIQDYVVRYHLASKSTSGTYFTLIDLVQSHGSL